MRRTDENAIRWYFTNTDFTNIEGETAGVCWPQKVLSVQVQGNFYALNPDFFPLWPHPFWRHKPFPNSFQTTDGFTSNYATFVWKNQHDGTTERGVALLPGHLGFHWDLSSTWLISHCFSFFGLSVCPQQLTHQNTFPQNVLFYLILSLTNNDVFSSKMRGSHGSILWSAVLLMQ